MKNTLRLFSLFVLCLGGVYAQGLTHITVDPTAATACLGAQIDPQYNTISGHMWACTNVGTTVSPNWQWTQIPTNTASAPQKFFGTAAPGSVTGNLPGDLFTDTTNHNEYVCNAPSGTAAPACTSVTTAGWLLINGGGGSSSFAQNNLGSITGTTNLPTASNTIESYGATLTGNVTFSWSPSAPTAGARLSFSLTQDATGFRSCTFPSGFSTVFDCSKAGPNVTINITGTWDGTAFDPAPTFSSFSAGIGIETAAPSGNPPAGVIWSWLDSTLHAPQWKNSSGVVTGGVTVGNGLFAALDTTALNAAYAQLNPTTSNTFTAGKTQITQSSATTAGERGVGAANPSSPVAGDRNTTLLGTRDYYDGTNWHYPFTSLTETVAANLIAAGPTSGGAAIPTARAMVTADLPVVHTRRVCMIVVGAENGSALANADIAPQGQQCFVTAAATVVEVTVRADAGTPNVVVSKDHAGSQTDLISAALATASAGAQACSNTGGTTGLDGTTTCTNTLSVTTLAAGDWIETHTATAGGTAKRMSIAVTYTLN